jgi:hypothetical protein
MIVVPGFYVLVRCPRCGSVLESRLFGLHSALGSPLMTCDRCGNVAEIDRREWIDFPPLHRISFGIATLIYTSFVAMFGGLVGAAGWHIAIVGDMDVDQPIEFRELLTDPAFVSSGIAFGLAIVAVQFFRIHRSLQRTLIEDDVPVRASFWDIETNLQLKWGFLLLSFAGVVFVGSLIRLMLR